MNKFKVFCEPLAYARRPGKLESAVLKHGQIRPRRLNYEHTWTLLVPSALRFDVKSVEFQVEPRVEQKGRNKSKSNDN